MTDNQIKDYLKLTDTPTPPMHLEENIMEDIRNYRIRRSERIRSLKWLLILTLLTIALFVALFFYGETLFSSFSSFERLPDLSNRMLTIGAAGAFFFLLLFVDPILSAYARRRYERAR